MKVIEEYRDNRNGEVVEVSWGENITSDFSVITSVINIIEGERDRENVRSDSPLAGRFTTIAIRIEL